MKKIYTTIVLLALVCTISNAQRRLIKANTSGDWTAAATWTTTGNPKTPTTNDSVVIATGKTVTISGNGTTITVIGGTLDIFGSLVIDEPNGSGRVNELDFTTFNQPIATPIVRVAAGATIKRGNNGNGTGEIHLLKDFFNDQLKYSTNTVTGVPVGQVAAGTVTGPAFAQNTYNQQPLYFTSGSNAALPVTFSLFKASVNQNNVLLNWTIGQQVNAKNFLVERSSNGSSWEQIGNIPVSTSNNQYQYMDAANNDLNYYRLKIVDLDGRISYSDMLVVRLKDILTNVALSPNPTANSVNITIGHSLSQQGFTINLFNRGGQLVGRRSMAAGTSVLSFDLSNYKSGIYTLDILFAGGKRETHQLSVVK